MTFDNRADIHGISAMIRTDDINSNADLDDIERKIIKGDLIIDEQQQTTTSQQYIMDIDNILGGGMNDSIRNYNNSDAEETIVHDTKYPSSVHARRGVASAHSYDVNADDNYHDDDDGSHYRDRSYDDNYNKKRRNVFKNKTKEEERAKALKQYLHGDDESDDDEKYNIGPETLEDDKIVMIEQIENLKVELEIEGCDVSKFEITENDNHDKIQDVWRKLKLKSQYKTYSNMFEEGILLGAEFVEWAFDGDKDYFGFKPCMIGWSDTVKVKLKRMRLETASFVSGIMQEYKMSAGLSIMTQLLISGVLYSVTKRKDEEDSNEPSRHTTDREFKNAMVDFDD